jgi:hypothetical protein
MMQERGFPRRGKNIVARHTAAIIRSAPVDQDWHAARDGSSPTCCRSRPERDSCFLGPNMQGFGGTTEIQKEIIGRSLGL